MHVNGSPSSAGALRAYTIDAADNEATIMSVIEVRDCLNFHAQAAIGHIEVIPLSATSDVVLVDGLLTSNAFAFDGLNPALINVWLLDDEGAAANTAGLREPDGYMNARGAGLNVDIVRFEECMWNLRNEGVVPRDIRE